MSSGSLQTFIPRRTVHVQGIRPGRYDVSVRPSASLTNRGWMMSWRHERRNCPCKRQVSQSCRSKSPRRGVLEQQGLLPAAPSGPQHPHPSLAAAKPWCSAPTASRLGPRRAGVGASACWPVRRMSRRGRRRPACNASGNLRLLISRCLAAGRRRLSCRKDLPHVKDGIGLPLTARRPAGLGRRRPADRALQCGKARTACKSRVVKSTGLACARARARRERASRRCSIILSRASAGRRRSMAQ